MYSAAGKTTNRNIPDEGNKSITKMLNVPIVFSASNASFIFTAASDARRLSFNCFDCSSLFSSCKSTNVNKAISLVDNTFTIFPLASTIGIAVMLLLESRRNACAAFIEELATIMSRSLGTKFNLSTDVSTIFTRMGK